jgi:hypothetical protein
MGQPEWTMSTANNVKAAFFRWVFLFILRVVFATDVQRFLPLLRPMHPEYGFRIHKHGFFVFFVDSK